jgi:ABC-type molybdate transport system substrate-binding protein
LLERRAHAIVGAAEKRNGAMDTSKYETETRKQLRRDQRTLAYRELQKKSAEQRTQLETKLRERNEVIARLVKKLVESGVAAEEAAKLAA